MPPKQVFRTLNPLSAPYVPTQEPTPKGGASKGDLLKGKAPPEPPTHRKQEKDLPLLSDRQFRKLVEEGDYKALEAHLNEGKRIQRISEEAQAFERWKKKSGGNGIWTYHNPEAEKTKEYAEKLERLAVWEEDEFEPAGLK